MRRTPTKARRSAASETQQRNEQLRTSFARRDDRLFEGYVFDPNDLTRRHWVDILIDGISVKTLRAETHVADLLAEGYGDGCYGFAYLMEPDETSSGAVIEARLTNVGTSVGHALSLRPSTKLDLPELVVQAAKVRWLGGLRIDGQVEIARDRKAARNYRIQAHIDGQVVAEERTHGWSAVVNSSGEERLTGSFDLHLPVRFADGLLHRVRVTTQDGEELNGSPLALVAFKDGLQAVLSDRPGAQSRLARATLFDRLVPMSIPFSSYPDWRDQFPPPIVKDGADTPTLVLLLGDGNLDATLQSLEQQSHQDWVAAAIPVREAPFGFDPQDILTLMTSDAPERELIVVSAAGAIFAADALARLTDALKGNPTAIAAYGDIEVNSDDGPAPLFLPAFDYERALEQGYCAHLFAARREPIIAALHSGASSIYRLFTSLLDDSSALPAVLHVPYPLAILDLPGKNASRQLAHATAENMKARGVAARIAISRAASFPAVRVTRDFDRSSRVSIVIPTRNRAKLLRACIRSILAADTELIEEIIVVDNGSTETDALDYFKEIDGKTAKVLRVPGPFNFSRLNNRAVRTAGADNVCLLNNDVEIATKDWLAEMCSRLTDPTVGAVGALLLWPNGFVQHGGTVVGTQLAAAHAFNNLTGEDPGYGDLLLAAHECSAVTAACMLTRRSDYLAVGGLDEACFPVNFNDVDYCLKLRSLGRRIVFTPHARLVHHESASRGADSTPDRVDRHRRELSLLRARWGDALINEPYYSPALALDPVPFSGLAWPPRPFDPRFADRPIPADIPPGF